MHIINHAPEFSALLSWSLIKLTWCNTISINYTNKITKLFQSLRGKKTGGRRQRSRTEVRVKRQSHWLNSRSKWRWTDQNPSSNCHELMNLECWSQISWFNFNHIWMLIWQQKLARLFAHLDLRWTLTLLFFNNELL